MEILSEEILDRDLARYEPELVNGITKIEFKKKLIDLKVSKMFLKQAVEMIDTIIDLHKNNADVVFNMLIVSDEYLFNVEKIFAKYLYANGVIDQAVLTDYGYGRNFDSNKKYLSIYNVRKELRENDVIDIKGASSNINTILKIDKHDFFKHKELLYYTFPFYTINQYSEKEYTNSFKKKIKAFGFTCDNSFIKKGVKYSEGVKVFDAELTNYLVNKKIHSQNRLALFEELQSQVDYQDWTVKRKTNKQGSNKDQILADVIGLDNIKKQVNRITKYITKNKDEKPMLHMVFSGNPGTGKTTVARLIAEELYEAGVIQKNEVIEVSRGDLVGEFIGHTAKKTKEVVEASMGRVLFIDEAYSLAVSKSDKDFGAECIATLVKEMEDKRGNLVVILAGYVEEMEKMLNTNIGLKSRIGFNIKFDNYTITELIDIFKLFVSKTKYVVEDDVIETITEYLQNELNNNPKTFANARIVRTLFERIKLIQAERSADFTIINQDAKMAINELTEEKYKQKSSIGFNQNQD